MIRMLRPYRSRDGLFCQQGHAAIAGVALAEQKVAVAMDKKAGNAGIHQRLDGNGYFAVQRVWVVIANPGFEQIPEDIKRIGVAGFTL